MHLKMEHSDNRPPSLCIMSVTKQSHRLSRAARLLPFHGKQRGAFEPLDCLTPCIPLRTSGRFFAFFGQDYAAISLPPI